MSDVSFEQADAVFVRMGYEFVMHDAGFALYRDTIDPGEHERLLPIDFSYGAISRRVLQRHLEKEGVPVEAFFAELDSIFG